jgi:hypothetical protein
MKKINKILILSTIVLITGCSNSKNINTNIPEGKDIIDFEQSKQLCLDYGKIDGIIMKNIINTTSQYYEVEILDQDKMYTCKIDIYGDIKTFNSQDLNQTISDTLLSKAKKISGADVLVKIENIDQGTLVYLTDKEKLYKVLIEDDGDMNVISKENLEIE